MNDRPCTTVMPGFCLRLRVIVTVALLFVAAGCSFQDLTEVTANVTPPPDTAPADNSAASKPSTCRQNDSFNNAVNIAQNAANLAQSAKSAEDWELVVLRWVQAVQAMQAIPPSSPKRTFARKKAVEYLQYMNVALSKATTATRSKLPFSTFNNQFLDQQLLLYMSYVAALGPPDVLIVGSSRSLLGVDPRVMQQGFASRGDLKVYNFGVNGATAQVVDLLVRQILTPEDLPRMILWADGVRAFNSGRVDKTYNGIIASPGYKRLSAGIRPTLPKMRSQTSQTCTSMEGLTRPVYADSRSYPYRKAFDTADGSRIVTFVLAAANTSVSSIDSNGFLPISIRFNPATYYRQNPRISGLYDADYQAFYLGGKQATALNNLRAFTRSRQIPLVFVNLPLTQNYLDSTRRKYERQFREFMQQQVSDKDFIFIDLGQQWLNRNEYFADPSHLNRFGAAALARQLAADNRIP